MAPLSKRQGGGILGDLAIECEHPYLRECPSEDEGGGQMNGIERTNRLDGERASRTLQNFFADRHHDPGPALPQDRSPQSLGIRFEEESARNGPHQYPFRFEECERRRDDCFRGLDLRGNIAAFRFVEEPRKKRGRLDIDRAQSPRSSLPARSSSIRRDAVPSESFTPVAFRGSRGRVGRITVPACAHSASSGLPPLSAME